MVSVANLSNSAEKFERRASQAGQDYASGVQSVSDSEQQQATIDSAETWATAVQEAIQDGRFQTGANNPTQSWQQQALEVGQSRFTQSAGQAGDAWQSGFQPFADALEQLSLPPRGPRGSSANFDRAREVGQRLNEVRDQI